MGIEYCVACGEPTGHSGDDSIYLGNKDATTGPWCEGCYQLVREAVLAEVDAEHRAGLAEFSVKVDGAIFASSYGPRQQALAQAMGYTSGYVGDGEEEVEIWETSCHPPRLMMVDNYEIIQAVR